MKDLFLAASIVLLFGCSAGESEDMYRPTSTMKDIMHSIVEPSANDIWNSVATTVDLDGLHESFPETDEEWDFVRQGAVSLVEATNLLLIPGRQVAEAGASAESPEVELEPAQIQEMIDTDFATWARLTHELYDVASETVTNIDSRNTSGFTDNVNRLDRVCEGCHLTYWYPNDEAARQAYEESAPE